MGFWDKVGGAAKWITDPKQILTAAGFAFGGPVGAGVGRAVGGMVPQSAGPVPWGALGADTGGFRKSTLADGLQWGDVGQAGKDFVSGYSAGRVGQQIPGIKELEGAFGQGGMWGGPGMPNQPQLGPEQIPGQSVINAQQPTPGMPAPYAQQQTMPNLSQLGPEQIPGQSLINAQRPMPGMPAQAPGAFQAPAPAGLMQDRTLDLQEARNLGGRMPYSSPPQDPGAFQPGTPDLGVGGPVDLGPDLGGARTSALSPPWPQPDTPPLIESGGMLERGVEAAGKWFGELTPMEQIYLATQAVGAATTSGGGHTIGREGTALLGEMGMFSPTSRYRAPTFDQWRSS
jgi:hypothetical protein